MPTEVSPRTPSITQVAWENYAADKASSKFMPLQQIDRGNFSALEVDWIWCSPDEALRTAYDYYGGDRPGDNLFAESLVALDVLNGQRIWHFQMIHHGIWDYDLPAAPNLIDIIVNGQPIRSGNRRAGVGVRAGWRLSSLGEYLCRYKSRWRTRKIW
ncbi:MAG: hypothetical protein ACE5OQ_14215 [Woeseia sp.]